MVRLWRMEGAAMTSETTARSRGPQYGADGRVTFFDDPAMDRFVSVLLNVASELWVLSERVATLNEIVTKAGLLSSEEICAALADPASDSRRAQELQDFIANAFAPLRETA